MTKRKSDELEQIQLFVAELINSEQDTHAKLVADLRKQIENTREFDDTVMVLTKIYEAKLKILETIFKKIQDI